jgi:hypothetical protein
MQPSSCPEWEYNTHPQHGTIVPTRVADLLGDLVRGDLDTRAVVLDTRPAHCRVFREVTPAGYDYYAGHYRGEPFPCLRFLRVGIEGDQRVGAAPESVGFLLGELNTQISAGLAALDANAALTTKERLKYIIPLACNALVAFLTVHPYANGNGHAARLMVWSILGRYGHWPYRWPVEPRPADPPYTSLICPAPKRGLQTARRLAAPLSHCPIVIFLSQRPCHNNQYLKSDRVND